MLALNLKDSPQLINLILPTNSYPIPSYPILSHPIPPYPQIEVVCDFVREKVAEEKSRSNLLGSIVTGDLNVASHIVVRFSEDKQRCVVDENPEYNVLMDLFKASGLEVEDIYKSFNPIKVRGMVPRNDCGFTLDVDLNRDCSKGEYFRVDYILNVRCQGGEGSSSLLPLSSSVVHNVWQEEKTTPVVNYDGKLVQKKCFSDHFGVVCSFSILNS